ncbi:hypothetical protein HGA92_05670 [Candidatus Gracilibacteria bacterium]|nr:hypothetical protein [Candidatus Gracilibacteria bacterium]NUJ98642.1 hypothetical protein [Candidatus Gracilibacteria bacterium]
MIKEESTHILFDGEKIIISPNLGKIFDFLMNIEREIESFIDFEKQLQKIKESYTETLGFTAFLAKKIEDNNIDFNYIISENPENIASKFDFHLPIRSQFIVLFASLETLFCLYITYIEKIDNEEDIRKKTMDKKETIKFLNKFILSNENEYFNVNKKIFSKISAKQIREIRNSLTHFYSVKGGINIIHNELNEKARKLEGKLKEKGNNNVIFISPNDLFLLIRGASKILIKSWSDDYLSDPIEFSEKITFVKSIVDKNSAVLIKNKDLNI